MSLNWKEIDLIIQELDAESAFIQNIDQIDRDELVLSLHQAGRSFDVLISLKKGAARLHELSKPYTRPAKPFRFAQLLRSRIKGGRIVSMIQVNKDRIVRIEILRAGETQFLFIRLWGSAENIFLTDPGLTIIDVFLRRPKRGEVAGKSLVLPEPKPENPEKQKVFEIREMEGHGSFNQKIEQWYADQMSSSAFSRKESLHEAYTALLKSRENRLQCRIDALQDEVIPDPEELKRIGNLILTHAGSIPPGSRSVELVDYGTGEVITVTLDTKLSASHNAEAYFTRYHKAAGAQEAKSRQIAELTLLMKKAQDELAAVPTLSIQEVEARYAKEKNREPATDASRKPAKGKKQIPETGLRFERQGFLLIVGRTGKENDELLRKQVRGNDLWLHARDYPGSYVFIKPPTGKTVPLPILIEAGMLAIHFSKGKQNGKGDVYYTQVKYLRRVKNGKIGLVIPTQEKNIHISVDDTLLRDILSSSLHPA